ncbi:hypothetical protein ACWEWX_08220 [Streptomyces asiaticus]
MKIHVRRGVKVGGLWYDGPVLAPYRGRPSGRSGKHRGKWVVSRDPRDCREVFFEDPADGSWHALRWTGLPPGDDVPAFSDSRVREVLREAARTGLKPMDDREQLPVLLDLVAARTLVAAWPTQMSRQQPAGELHPAQCRGRIIGHAEAFRSPRPCGHRLDRANSPAVRPDPEVIDLQPRLLDLARAPAPGPVLSASRPASAAEHSTTSARSHC